MKYDCGLIQDILPLYMEGSLSEVSVGIVKAHMQECPSCRKEMEREMERAGAEEERAEQDLYQQQSLAYAERIRRRRKKIMRLTGTAFLAAVGLTAVFCFYLFSGLMEYRAEAFVSRSDAQDYIDRGWIPGNLPENAGGIRLYYQLDADRINGKFKAEGEEREAFYEGLQESGSGEFEKVSTLNREFKAVKQELLRSGASFYKDGEFIFAEDEDWIYFFSMK